MRPRGTLALLIAFALPVGLVLSACGASSVSARQLRIGVTRICRGAQRRTSRIPTPRLPSQGARYLSRGLAALTPELAALRALHPPDDLARLYRDGLDATAGELRALRSTLKGLDAGNDPVVAIKTLQQQLAPLERRAAHDWQSLAIPGCLNS